MEIMSKEELLKIQTCVLKVNIHCDGCKQKIKKVLQKIDGVYKTSIDAEQGKVTVSGNVDSATLIKKLAKSGKHAQLWGAQKAFNSNQNQNQFKNMQIKGNNSKSSQAQKGGGNQQPQAQAQKGGGQNQQQQQLKNPQDLKLPPQLRGLNINNNPKQKSVKFQLPEDDDDDDDDDDFDDDYDSEDDEYDDYDEDDELAGIPNHSINKMKPLMGNNGGQGMGQNPEQMKALAAAMNAKKGGAGAGSVGTTNKGGGGNGVVPVQINVNGGKKGGGNNQNQTAKDGFKNSGGSASDGSNVSMNGNGGGGGKKNGTNGAMGNMGSSQGGLGNGYMGIPAVQGLPPTATTGGYHQGAGPEIMSGNPYHHQQQQQMMAAMMDQQRGNGNERFQPMMYARPPPASNYMAPPYPYGYPYSHQPPSNDGYGQFFSDEGSSSSCNII